VKCDYSLNIQQHQSGRWRLREETNGTDVWSCLSIRGSNIQINTIRTFNYAMHCSVTRDFTLTLFKRRTFYFIFHKIYRVRVVRMQVLLHSQGWGNVRGGSIQGEMSRGKCPTLVDPGKHCSAFIRCYLRQTTSYVERISHCMRRVFATSGEVERSHYSYTRVDVITPNVSK